MNRIGMIAAALTVACGWMLAQERPAGEIRNGRTAVPERDQSALQEKPVAAASRTGSAPTPQNEKPAGGWWNDAFAERNVSLSKVLAKPESWRDVPVSFVIQFHQLGKTGPAFFTRFESDAWLAFSAWADDAALWEKKAFENDFPHLFVRRDSADCRAVLAAAIYDRFAVSGVVRDVIKGKPWIEVTSVRTLPEKINEGSLVHLVKGLTLRDHRRFDAAAREFAAADADTLPVSVRLLAMREHAFAQLNCRKPKSAEEQLLAALAIDPGNSETALALDHVREVMKEMPERVPASRPVAPVVRPEPEPEEPVTPGPPDPLADRPRRSPIRLPFPKAAPTPASRSPRGGGRQSVPPRTQDAPPTPDEPVADPDR